MSRQVIRNGFVVTGDPALGDLPDADVLIEDDVIAEIAPRLDVGEDAEVIDARRRIVMPGMIDSHRHVWQGALRSVCSDGSLVDYVTQIRMHAARFFTAEDMYAVQLHGALEALDAGVTSVTDYCHNLLTPDHAHEAIRGLRESGLRVVWNYGFNYPPQADPTFRSLQDRIAFGRELAKHEFTGRDALVTLGVAPEEAPFAGSSERLAAQFGLARELDARVFWHCNSGGIGGANQRDVAAIAELGALGSDVTLVHMYATDEDEWPMVAEAGAAVAFTPETELQMGMMWPSTRICAELGIPFGIGTDITSNNSADLFAAMRIGLQALRCHHIDGDAEARGPFPLGTPISCADALAWGTRGGARALGLEDRVGSLRPGKQADVVLLRGDSLNMAGWDRSHPARSIVQQARPSDVDTVWVAGEIRKREGRLLGDVGRACSLLEAASERVHARIAESGGIELPLDETMARMQAVTRSEDGKYEFDA
ncbi:MAG: amidohydrolase family protein [Myxococcota bacterium]|nr:amidohydrolase family protein [Myxococcota bacterium]